MTSFDPERFEDKYEHYFPELQKAYKAAFETMNEQYDSTLVHAIDQQILSESEPFYQEDGTFRIELPANAYDRLEGVAIDEQTFQKTMNRYCEEIDSELRAVFDLIE
jgi:uncharacterized protein YeaO (DUF488 family)